MSFKTTPSPAHVLKLPAMHVAFLPHMRLLSDMQMSQPDLQRALSSTCLNDGRVVVQSRRSDHPKLSSKDSQLVVSAAKA